MRQPGCRRRTCGRSTRSIWQPPSASATAWASSSAMTGDWRMPPSRPVSRWRCPEPEIASSSMIPNAAMNAALAAVASRHRRRHRGARSARCAPRPCVRRGHSVDRRSTDLLLSLVNYAETLVRPAENHDTMRAAIEALTALGIRLVAPTPAIARDAARYGDRTSASPMVSPSRRRRAMVRASRRSTFACGERFLRSAWSWRQRCPELQR